MTRDNRLKVALGDLKHSTVGRHSVYMPIGIGYIASYAISHLGADNIEARLYDDPDRLLDDIDAWRPNVLGLANYCWNSQVAMRVFRYAKERIAGILCVSGGPDFPLDLPECRTFLKQRPVIDFYAYLEGEIPFAMLLAKILDGGSVDDLKRTPQDGMMNLHPDDGSPVVGPEPPRLIDMDVIPSPYLTGLMEQWFDGKTAPSLETARGCPYKCAFCIQGEKAWSKIGRFSVERINAELTYMAERMTNYPGIMLNICDSNFAMYKRDEEIAEHLRHLQDTYNWPNNFCANTGKSQYERSMRIAELLQKGLQVTCSVQSWNEETLAVIRRKNISFEKYKEIQDEIKRRGLKMIADTIMPLPEETKESFLEGIRLLVSAGVDRLSTFTTMMLKGTCLASSECRERYRMQTRFRILPRQFGEYRGEKCFEIEEVCVSTNTMPFKDYLSCRGFGFIATIFSSKQYDICHRLLEEAGADRFEWLCALWETIESRAMVLTSLYEDFLEEAQAELYPSEEAIYGHFSDEENYARLLAGDFGDNLIRKYHTRLVLEQSLPATTLAFEVLKKLCPVSDERQRAAIDAAWQWATAVRNVGAVFTDPSYLGKVDNLKLPFDVNEWYRQGVADKPLTGFETPVCYRLFSDRDDIEAFLAQQRDLYGSLFFLVSNFLVYYGEKDLWRRCETMKKPVPAAQQAAEA